MRKFLVLSYKYLLTFKLEETLQRLPLLVARVDTPGESLGRPLLAAGCVDI